MTLFSLAGSPDLASHTAQPEKDLEKKMTATSGRRCLELFERSGRATSWGKTLLASLVGMEGWYSTRCRLIWKLKGTKYGRLYFQLAPSTLHTDATGFGLLLKTPTKMDGEVSNGKSNPVSGNSGTLAQEIMSGYAPTMEKLNLLPTVQTQGLKVCDKNGKTQFMDLKLLPTPAAQDGKNGTFPQSQALRDTVPGAVMRMLPTPQAADGFKTTANQNQDNLHKTFQTGGDFQLNPLFVAEMMGFPTDWLELPFQDTDANL